MNKAHKIRDSFAEMYVAGILSDNQWNIYLPRRDIGMDFIATYNSDNGLLVRPVQVKGKYPTDEKSDTNLFGFYGTLTQTHVDMILAIPFFTTEDAKAPSFISYLPFSMITENSNKIGTYHCYPAKIKNGKIDKRQEYEKFFDENGVELITKLEFSKIRG